MSDDRESLEFATSQPTSRRSAGRFVARILCFLLAFVGLLPILLGIAIRVPVVRFAVIDVVRRELMKQHIDATFDVAPSLWPLAIVLNDVRVYSKDGGSPAIDAGRISASPRVLGLLAGKLEFDSIELRDAKIRAELAMSKDEKGGDVLEIQNLGLKIPLPVSDPNEAKKPFVLPVRDISLSSVDLNVRFDAVRARMFAVDANLTAIDGPKGSILEVAVTSPRLMTETTRSRPRPAAAQAAVAQPTLPPGQLSPPTPLSAEQGKSKPVYDTVFDDDELCGIEARVRYEPPTGIRIRRLFAHGGMDQDEAANTPPGCLLADTDPRKVDLQLSNINLLLSETKAPPKASGHATARVPLTVVSRIEGAPDMAGWAKLDAELQYSPEHKLPDGNGVLSVENIRIDKFAFSKKIESHFSIKSDVIKSSNTFISIAEGEAKLYDVTVSPFEEGVPLHANASIKNSSFEALMRDLGVSKHPLVTWDLDDLKVTSFKGTLVPLNLAGDIAGSTSNFAVYDRGADNPAHTRIIGVRMALLGTRVVVSPDKLSFTNVKLNTGASVVEGGSVGIGFAGGIQVDVPKTRIDLRELSPLTSLPLAGIADVKVRVAGDTSDPILLGEGRIDNFVLGEMKLGSITNLKARQQGKSVTLTDVKVQKGGSAYEMPSARFDFGGDSNVKLEGEISTKAFDLRELLSLWNMDQDPRFADYEAKIETRQHLRLVLGGHEDVCGGGLIQTSGPIVVRNLKVLGESFDEGTANFDLNWPDRQAGFDGAEVRVNSFALHKRKRAEETRGSVLGSATILRGGELRANAVFESMPIHRLDSLGAAADLLSGNLSGWANVTGTLERWVASGSVESNTTRINGVRYGESNVAFNITQVPPTPSGPEPVRPRTACGGVRSPPFDRESYLRNRQVPQGEIAITGSLLGGQLLARRLVMTREESPTYSGDVALAKFDLGALSRVINPPTYGDAEKEERSLGGELTGEVHVERINKDKLGEASATFLVKELSLLASGQRLNLAPSGAPLQLAQGKVTIPKLTFGLASSAKVNGGLSIEGQVEDVFEKKSKLDVRGELTPIDLSVLAGIVPRLNRSAGMLRGSLRARGSLSEPDITGGLQLRNGEFSISGVPSISSADVDIVATDNEAKIQWASARFAGGELAILGRVPLRGASAGLLQGNVLGRSLHLEPADGIKTTIDCDLGVALRVFGDGPSKLPRISGKASLSSFEYTRPINLDLTQSLGNTARRTAVETFDPSQDKVAIDVQVTATQPLRVKNNLIDMQLSIADPGLVVSGTNQRLGLRGELRSLEGGTLRLLANEFELRQVAVSFNDPSRILANLDVLAVTNYRRYSAGASSGGGSRGSDWRISLRVTGPSDSPKLEMTSEPALSQEDITLLLTIGLTKAEVDQLGSGALSVAVYEAAGTVSGADKAVRKVIPIDDFRFGSFYSPTTGKSEPNFTVGKRLTPAIQASISSGISETRQIRTNIEWRLSQRISAQTFYDNINNSSGLNFGNIGVGFRWRLEFE
jgi:translocation and assembly module TamB